MLAIELRQRSLVYGSGLRVLGSALFLLLAAPVFGASDAEKCEAAKLTAAGQYSKCRFSSAKSALLRGASPNYSACDERYDTRWAKAETNFGAACRTSGDRAAVASYSSASASALWRHLQAGCGDGTCAVSEDCETCPADCACSDSETCSRSSTAPYPASCQSLVPPTCDDGFCDDGASSGFRTEGCYNCPADCGCADPEVCKRFPPGADPFGQCVGAECGDGQCDGTLITIFDVKLPMEDCLKCPSDCACAEGSACEEHAVPILGWGRADYGSCKVLVPRCGSGDSCSTVTCSATRCTRQRNCLCPPGKACSDNTTPGEAIGGSCVTGKRVFVTSQSFRGDFGGVDRADRICRNAALDAGLGGSFKAWIGDDVSPAPAARFRHATIPYFKRVIGSGDEIVANDWQDLTDGTLITSIDTTEYGNDVVSTTYTAWTSVKVDGTDDPGPQCDPSWSNSSSAATGAVGSLDDFNQSWTSDSVDLCSNESHLYCFEQ